MVRPLFVLLSCVLLGEPALAQRDPDFDVPGYSPRPPRPPATGLAQEFEVMAGAQTLGGDTDVHRTYGLLPSAGIGISCQGTDRVRWALTVRYAQSSGSPYFDDTVFHLDDTATLRAVPVTLGLRLVDPSSESWRLNIGVALQLAWVEETLPGGMGETDQVFSGYAAGMLVTVATEWRSSSDRRAIGLELAAGGSGGTLEAGRDDHEIDLTGLHVRLYTAVRLGGGQEVQP